jgi:hypothetical protein
LSARHRERKQPGHESPSEGRHAFDVTSATPSISRGHELPQLPADRVSRHAEDAVNRPSSGRAMAALLRHYPPAAHARGIRSRFACRTAWSLASTPSRWRMIPNAAGKDQRDLTKFCDQAAPSVTDLPIRRIAQAVQPTPVQRSALDELKEASVQAAEALKVDCPTYQTLTPTVASRQWRSGWTRPSPRRRPFSRLSRNSTIR